MLRVMACPLAIVNVTSFFSRTTPMSSNVAVGIHVNPLPVPTNARRIVADRDRWAGFAKPSSTGNLSTGNP